MRTRKRILAVALALLFAVAAAGCGRSAGEEQEDPGQEPDQAAEEESVKTIKLYGDHPRTLTVPANPNAYWGTQERPVPRNQTEQVGHFWKVQVLDINPDAWSIVQAENIYNDPPQEGKQYVMARIKLSNIDIETREPYFDLKFRYLGNDGVGYSGSCGVIPDQLYDVPEMYPGGTTEANVCFSVPSEVISGGSIVVDGRYESRVFFAGVPKS